MKKIIAILTVLISLIITGCSGSDTYQGKWKATAIDGSHVEINFSPDTLTFTQNGKIRQFEYSQNSINIENSISTYGIKLEGGRTLKIQFPNNNDESKGAILDLNDKPQFIISRKNYIEYNDVYGL